MIRVGIIGLSEGNGHPFSFSAIVNGYDRAAFALSGWPGILQYLDRQPTEAFGFSGVEVTHAWTQDAEVTAKLCAATRIAYPVADWRVMLGQVDALIIGRDDWRTHIEFAKPFLDAGVAVFIDKPLTLDSCELDYFQPHLAAGRLMSTAGLRYARELDVLRNGTVSVGKVRHVAATVLNDMERYGVHMLDALAGLGLAPVGAVTRLAARHESFALNLTDGVQVSLNCLGPVAKTFHISVFGESGHAHFDLHDNFSAFRRTLEAFFGMVATGTPPIAPQQVIDTMHLISAVRYLEPGKTWSPANG